MAEGVGGGRGAVVCADLQVDVGDVALHGARAEEERRRDRAVAVPGSEQPEHLDLPTRKAIGAGGRVGRGCAGIVEAGDQRGGAGEGGASVERQEDGAGLDQRGMCARCIGVGQVQFGQGQQRQGALIGGGAGLGQGERGFQVTHGLAMASHRRLQLTEGAVACANAASACCRARSRSPVARW